MFKTNVSLCVNHYYKLMSLGFMFLKVYLVMSYLLVGWVRVTYKILIADLADLNMSNSMGPLSIVYWLCSRYMYLISFSW